MRAIKNYLFHQASMPVLGVLAVMFLMLTNSAEAAPKWLQVSTGDQAACGILVDNTLWCWGRVGRYYGKTSSGKSYDFGPTIPTPTLMSLDADWQSVSVGRRYLDTDDLSSIPACALKMDGTRYCWGIDMRQGTLGMGGPVSIDTNFEPQQAGTGKWLQISIGSEHSCGITTQHTLNCWGSNWHGELGFAFSSSNTQWLPKQVGVDRDWASVSVSTFYSCALKTDGTRYCWGDNTYGQLGLGSGASSQVTTPTRVNNERKWSEIATGATHACGVDMDGLLYCWGNNYYSQLGIGLTATSTRNSPQKVGSSGYWQSISLGDRSTCGLQDGVRRCWGYNPDYILGVGSKSWSAGNTLYPAALYLELRLGTTWQSVSTNGTYSCGIQDNETLWCWGVNDYGVVGVGDNASTEYNMPVQITVIR